MCRLHQKEHEHEGLHVSRQQAHYRHQNRRCTKRLASPRIALHQESHLTEPQLSTEKSHLGDLNDSYQKQRHEKILFPKEKMKIDNTKANSGHNLPKEKIDVATKRLA